MKRIFVVLFLLQILTMVPARAMNFSFTGTFSQDDDVQLFTFFVGGSS